MNKMVVTIALVVVGLLLIGAVFYAQRKSGNGKEEISSEVVECKDKFYYEICCSSPKLGPVEYLSIDFIGESGTLSCFGTSTVDNGIGNGMDGVARDLSSRHSLPKAIEAIWVSYTDRKVYKISSLLPYDTILSLFKYGGEPCLPADKGINFEEVHKFIQCLDICFLPSGKVVLFLKAGVKTILLDWSAYGSIVTDDEILSQIYTKWGLEDMDQYYDVYYSKEESPEYEYWHNYMDKYGSVGPLMERYLQRFNYELKFEFEDKKSNIYSVESQFTNGEQHWETSKFNEAFKMPSRLKESCMVWNTKDFHYTCFMYFNEEEVLRVFDEAYGEDRMQKGELRVKVCKYNNLFDISLNVGEKSIKLEKTEIRVFQDPIDDPDGDGTLIYKNYEGNHRNLFIDDEGYFQE